MILVLLVLFNRNILSVHFKSMRNMEMRWQSLAITMKDVNFQALTTPKH